MAFNGDNKKTYLSPSHASSNRSKSPHKSPSSLRYQKGSTSGFDDLIRVSSDDEEESDQNSSCQRSNISKNSADRKASHYRNKNMRFDYSQDYSNQLDLTTSTKLGKSRENYLNEITEETPASDENLTNNSDLSDGQSDEGLEFEYRPKKNLGIFWSSNAESVEDLVADFKNTKQMNSQIIKAVCARSDCKCAFKDGEPLLLFPMLDTYVAYATWEVSHNHQSSQQNVATKHTINMSRSTSRKTPDPESQTKLMIFKQCKGWYEILNENHAAIPFYTSVEQIKRSKPNSFITRENIKVLIAPKTLQIPKGQFSPELLQIAQSSNVIAESTPKVLKSGTIFKYVEYFPNCKVVRGKKFKCINLIFVIEKIPGSLDPESEDYQRFVYIGTEESSRESYFSPKVSLSIVAGPENISGVHTIGNILRKFRLPVSVRPVAVNSASASNAYREGGNNQMELPLMPGIPLTDKHFMRIRSIYCGDLFILAAINNPERLYIITPKMLPDHSFYVGTTQDKKYIELMRHHSLHVSEFLSNGHSFSAMEYLLKHLQQSRYPVKYFRNNYHNNLTKDEVHKIYSATGRDPRVGPECSMTPNQVDELYDELDDIYFFIRNGYYPPKKTSYSMRGRETVSMNGEGTDQSHLHNYKPSNTQKKVMAQGGVRRADELLAESLNILKDPHGI